MQPGFNDYIPAQPNVDFYFSKGPDQISNQEKYTICEGLNKFYDFYQRQIPNYMNYNDIVFFNENQINEVVTQNENKSICRVYPNICKLSIKLKNPQNAEDFWRQCDYCVMLFCKKLNLDVREFAPPTKKMKLV